MEREAVVWNCSCVNTLKGTVLHRTVARDRVNEKPIRGTVPYRTVPKSRVNAALILLFLILSNYLTTKKMFDARAHAVELGPWSSAPFPFCNSSEVARIKGLFKVPTFISLIKIDHFHRRKDILAKGAQKLCSDDNAL